MGKSIYAGCKILWTNQIALFRAPFFTWRCGDKCLLVAQAAKYCGPIRLLRSEPHPSPGGVGQVYASFTGCRILDCCSSEHQDVGTSIYIILLIKGAQYSGPIRLLHLEPHPLPGSVGQVYATFTICRILQSNQIEPHHSPGGMQTSSFYLHRLQDILEAGSSPSTAQYNYMIYLQFVTDSICFSVTLKSANLLTLQCSVWEVIQ